jgi:predicted nucleic acid-binding protein
MTPLPNGLAVVLRLATHGVGARSGSAPISLSATPATEATLARSSKQPSRKIENARATWLKQFVHVLPPNLNRLLFWTRTSKSAAEALFSEDFVGRILPFDGDAARAFATIAASRRTRGRPMAQLDAQIAAIARSRSAAIATRNTDDFDRCGIPVLDPWDSTSRLY